MNSSLKKDFLTLFDKGNCAGERRPFDLVRVPLRFCAFSKSFLLQILKSSSVVSLVLPLLFFGPLFGQESTGTVYERLLRVEIPVKSDNETHRLIPVGEFGVVVFFKSVEVVDQDKVKWYFSFYDSDLKLKWSKGIALNVNLDYLQYSTARDTLNLLFTNNGKDKASDQILQVVRLSLTKNVFIGLQGKIPENAVITDFKVRNHHAFIGFNVKNEPARLLRMDLLSGNNTLFSLSGQELSLLSDFDIDTIDGNVSAVIRKQVDKNQSCYFFTLLDSTFKVIGETPIPEASPGQDLNSARLMPLSSNEFIVSGTYGTFSGQKSNGKPQMPDESTGIYFASIKGFTLQFLKLYNFLDFQNAGQLVNGSDMESLKKKAKKKNKELSEYSLELTLLAHPLRISKQRLIFLAEAFYPQYHTENFTDFDFYGRPFTNSYTVFDGYRYKSAVVAGFDMTGKLLWDNVFEIRNLVTNELTPRVVLFPEGDNDVMAYLSEGKIASKIIHESKVVEKTDYSPLESGFPNDKLLTESKSKMVSWYGDFFICYGYQEIKNVALENNNRRWVFYFNKIRFD
jgi:hypothetical protein